MIRGMADDARHTVDLDAATLRATLDERWPDATGDRRVEPDETHRLVLLHPLYDGFVTLDLLARTDLDHVQVEPDETLERIVTAHHRIGRIARGQHLPIDLELHPRAIGTRPVTGLLHLRDAQGEALAPAVRITLATDFTLDCVLAGAVDGPFETPAAFEQAVDELLAAAGGPRRLARRIEALEAGRRDPGWSRLPWGRR